MTGTRITPDAIRPNVGGLYRERDTGRTLRLHTVSEGWAFLVTESGLCRPIKLSTFLDKWTHANAREDA